MTALQPIESNLAQDFDPHCWMGMVLEHFARAEQAIGKLSVAIGLPINNGSLGSLNELRKRLAVQEGKKFKALDNRIARWSQNRPFRHLLAHATITRLFDANGRPVIITRHLPRDANDVTPDRLWTFEDQKDLLRQASNDSRSICDQVANLLADPAQVAALRKA
ncbi:hypothetical protein K3172_02210 [Qipengyuania sp. 6B39]|uniref:hypothetical protein n=1 Tax=Qipengyuania proteolytica TaxID=2867239 RepID=UPI001C894DE0|nr:hypothetical protein [Qipengyuania proteolytica]MBX7494666.1 hypothetical protein [Qipengyuania proteolytica]